MTPDLSRRAAQAMLPIMFPDDVKHAFVNELENAETFEDLPQRAKDIILFGETKRGTVSSVPLPDKLAKAYSENRNLPSNYRPASSDDVPDGRNCGNCAYFGNGWCDWWDEKVETNYYCNKWEDSEGEEEEEEEMEIEIELKAEINLVPPVFMRSAARRGLKLYEEGHGGDGLVRGTIVDARKMMNGESLSEDKWKRIGPWIARHMVDLDAPKNNNPNDPGYPGAGLVAHLLWGSGPSKAQAKRAMDYANRLVDRLDESRAASQPAPPKDRIKGSDKNPKGSAKNQSGGISLDDATETSLSNKVAEHNEKMDKADRPVWTRVRLGALKAVWRRGAGAYSTSHRPGVSRAAWAMARVNAFMYLSRTGRPANPKYVTDNDLLHPDHPKSSKGK